MDWIHTQEAGTQYHKPSLNLELSWEEKKQVTEEHVATGLGRGH